MNDDIAALLEKHKPDKLVRCSGCCEPHRSKLVEILDYLIEHQERVTLVTLWHMIVEATDYPFGASALQRHFTHEPKYRQMLGAQSE